MCVIATALLYTCNHTPGFGWLRPTENPMKVDDWERTGRAEVLFMMIIEVEKMLLVYHFLQHFTTRQFYSLLNTVGVLFRVLS